MWIGIISKVAGECRPLELVGNHLTIAAHAERYANQPSNPVHRGQSVANVEAARAMVQPYPADEMIVGRPFMRSH
ncbi:MULTISPECIES: hypothetical protein [unclassified Burkholderia]|uniref:hypothetical protein n=1 Tax=unclassified Burkholderia TaxID=2613784 RepID=UPI0012E35161|nr:MULTISPECIES: hypothetical protein [unclassified Burkholderia]